ncbi:hypothetical protein [Streptomyces sp. MAR25Y5]|uniref:restriction endonuclease subunit S n=1 Tax=Streptomyces sp. MAR25Y5 TaxID=2962028 RepID=UPI0020B67C2E|nr:hypothetical protein [Streptomyces sp. MAR25Y5]MCP3767161.1 hypothetical protein [Streptomyces sp. MAR25Y5]
MLESPPKNGYSPKDVPEWTGLKALGLGCLTPKGFAPSQLKNVPDSAMARRFTLVDGDLLMSRANTRELVGLAGRFTQIGAACIYPDLMMRLRPKVEQCLPGYLEIVLRSATVRRAVQAGARGTSESMVKISASLVEDLRIPLPPLPEQRDIVAANEAFERRIRDLERVAQKRSTLLSAAVSALLRGQDSSGTTLETMMVACDPGITLGAHRAPQKRAAGYLRVANVRMGWIDTSDVASLESTSSDRPRYELEAGDVLVVEGHANPEQIGRAALVGPAEEGLLYQNHLFRLRFDRDEVVPEFAMLWLNSEAVRSYWISRCATSSGLYTINSKLLAGAPFPVVPIEEQRKIVETWRTGIRAIDSLHGQIAKVRTIQQGVIEDLLSGRTRVNPT